MKSLGSDVQNYINFENKINIWKYLRDMSCLSARISDNLINQF